MSRSLRACLALLPLALAPGLAAAQDAAQAPWAVSCREATAAPAAGQPAGGAEAQAAAPAAQAPRCAMSQRLVQKEGGAQVLLVGLAPAPPPASPPAEGASQPAAIMRMALPLGFDFTSGVTLLIDGKPWKAIPVRTCLASGCTAGLALAAEDVAALKAGTRMGVAVKALGGKVLAWPVSLAGFTRAYDEMVAQEAGG